MSTEKAGIKAEPLKRLYEFGPFRIDPEKRLLRRDGEVVQLTPKVFDALLLLVESSGQLVSKEDLMSRLWPDSFVEETGLTRNISILRKALGESPHEHQYIVTVPGCGYRFVAEVREAPGEPADVNFSERARTSIVLSEEEINGTDGLLISGGRRYRKAALPLLVITVIGFAIIVFKFIGRDRTGADPEEPFRRLTTTRLTDTGDIGAAAISPDGTYVAYTTTDIQQLSSLRIKHLPTLSDTEIIPPRKFVYGFLGFSPEGDYIYYAGTDNRVNFFSLYRVPLLGPPSRKVIDNVDSAVSFSLDGKQFVFCRHDPDRTQKLLIVANADGTGEQEIAAIRYPEDFGRPAWSPDGKVIACAAGHADGGYNKYVVEVKVGDWALREISSRRWKWVGEMAWLSDGSGLLMIAADKAVNPYQVWRLSYPGGEARRITNDAETYTRLSLSTDSRRLLLTHSGRFANVWVVPAEDASQARQITSGGGFYGSILSWTPDGRIVHESPRGAVREISVMDRDGGNRRPLVGDTTNPGYVGAPSVSPDGRYIVFASDPTGTRHIYRMDMDGNNPVQLTHGKGEWAVSYSPDSRWVVYSDIGSDRPTIWKVSIDGGEPIQLTDIFSFAPAVSPDGKLIACSYYDERPESWWKIAVFPFEGGEPIKILPNPIRAWSGSFVRWTPDGSALTYLDPNDGAQNIWMQPLDGGKPKKVTDFKSDGIFGFNWSHDGKYLACVRGVSKRDLVLLTDFLDRRTLVATRD